MTGDVVIRAEGIGKKYVIGHEGERGRNESLRDVIVRGARNLRRSAMDTLRGRPVIMGDEVEEFWALKDVSFEVRRGEVMGFIGRNGAGKSTLLKILSRITEPTEGRMTIEGRVASLLEVGTGFHPELSGRENIYLNGAILGMARAETRRKFDEIVDFAGIERFLDTPVKRYSSGMYVRLAFAVAAHLEPEILIIDEVLAVGDAEFQKKCLGKMSDISRREGRTVLFVTHSMAVAQRLCHRLVLLANGRICLDSEPTAAIAEYLGVTTSDTYSGSPSATKPSITSASVRAQDGFVQLSMEYESPFPLAPPVAGFVFYDPTGTPLFGSTTRTEASAEFPRTARSGRFEATIPTSSLRSNLYSISLWLADSYVDHCVLEGALKVNIDGAPSEVSPQILGSIRVPVEWGYSQQMNASTVELSSLSTPQRLDNAR